MVIVLPSGTVSVPAPLAPPPEGMEAEPAEQGGGAGLAEPAEHSVEQGA